MVCLIDTSIPLIACFCEFSMRPDIWNSAYGTPYASLKLSKGSIGGVVVLLDDLMKKWWNATDRFEEFAFSLHHGS